jgi:hypothetical protein
MQGRFTEQRFLGTDTSPQLQGTCLFLNLNLIRKMVKGYIQQRVFKLAILLA